jgi:hypothetical protein
MASIWASPTSGALLNDGNPWLRGDTANITLQLNTLHPLYGDFNSIDLIGGILPQGLYYNGGTRKIMGTIEQLPKGQTEYPVVFRVNFQNSTRTYDRSFNLIVDPVDEEQHWNIPTGIQYLGTFNRGSGLTVQLDIVNPDQDPLVYKAVGYVGPVGTFQGLPLGLEVDTQGRLVGSPTITGNSPGDYYFRVYARDPDDLISNPRKEGAPRTSEKIYRLTIGEEIVLDARLSDAVRWETPAGSLGSTYETYPSHFAVKAVPQYEVNGVTSSETQSIQYSLTAKSKPLPDGLILDPMSGMIIGRCPYVTINKTSEFTVEARVVFVHNDTGAVRLSSIAGERTFSITIRNIFTSDATTSLHVNVPPQVRSKIARWIWGNKAEVRPDYTENSLIYTGNGVTTKFLAPSRVTGKTDDTIVVLIDDQVTNRPYNELNEGDKDYVEFVTGVDNTYTDLTGWTAEGNGNWTVQAGNSTVRQSINGTATVFYSDYLAFGKKLSGTIQVAANAGDDDFIGFVVGFKPGDIASTTTDFLMIDWKKGQQDATPPGFAVSQVKKGLSSTSASWNHVPSGGVTELARGSTLGSVGWQHGQSYTFDIEFTATNLKVWVDGVLQCDVNGTFSDGRFGFYNNSQSGVTYAGVASTYLAPPNGVQIKVIRYINQAPGATSNKLTVLGWDNLFRRADSYFGKKREYRILITNGLNFTGGNFLDFLKDYHHPTTLRVGEVRSARARSPEGTHLYDVIYLTVNDPMEGAGGFDSNGVEERLPRYVVGQVPRAIEQWNLTKEMDQYFPNSVNNLRLDLINKFNRLQGQQGIGILGREGLPLWMMCEQELGKPSTVIGYQCAIELAYVRAGSGPAIVRTLSTSGMNTDLQGSSIEVDRYLLSSDGFSSTTFYDDTDGIWNDDDSMDMDFLNIITFDGPENPDTPTTNPTTFDRSLQSEIKYYKFPPGER